MKKLRLVFDFWRGHRLWAAGLLVGTAIGTAITLAFPYMLRYIIDGIKQGVEQAVLVRYVLILLGFGLLRGINHVVLPYLRAMVNLRFQWVVRSRVFGRVLETGHSFTNRFPTGDVMQRLDHDLTELSWFACSSLFRFVAACFTLVFALALMLSMNPLLTAITVLPTGLGVFIWMKLGPLVYRRYMKWRELISDINNRIESAFTGIRLVKGHNMQSRLAGDFRATLDRRVAAAIDTIRAESKIDVFYMGVGQIGVLLVLWAGGFLVVRDQLTLGEFVAFNAYVMMLITPMWDIGNLFVMGRRAQGGCERIGALEEHRPEVRDPDRPTAARPGALELRDVEFGYDGQPALKAVTMKFEPGRRVGIAGPVGSGKSTVFRLLFRLADPQSGSVRLGGQDVRELDLDAYRGLFGYAPQESTLFSDTLRNNIAFGREVDERELDRTIDLAQFRRELAEMKDGLDEVLGERGTRLSGGQKGRVAIARALVDQPRILVFDDATSALDAETERDLVNRLSDELAGTTVIIVSHRLSILSACDHVYVLDRGELKEQGTHADLLAQRGLYWDLYERQLIRQELEVM